MLSRKHYTAIANILANNQPDIHKAYVRCIARQLAGYFEQDNPRFDRKKFLEACGVYEL